MAEPSLTEVFGPGATQTATTLTITKADLPGLTAAIDNRAEQQLPFIFLYLPEQSYYYHNANYYTKVKKASPRRF